MEIFNSKNVIIIITLLIMLGGAFIIYTNIQKKIEPAKFNISKLKIYHKEVKPGENVTIKINLENTGGEIGNHTVELKINGTKTETKNIELGPGENITVKFTISKNVTNAYTVNIGDLSGTFEVRTCAILRVQGTELVNGNNETIYLRGLQVGLNDRRKNHIGGTATSIEQTWFHEEDVSEIKNYGGNIIEIHQIPIEKIMPTIGNIDESYIINWLDHWVSWCEKFKVYYILSFDSFHATEYYFNQWGPRMPAWVFESGGHSKPTTMEEQATIVHAFWNINKTNLDQARQAFYDIGAYLANRYLNNQYLIFGTINEPMHHTHEWMTDAEAQHLGVTYSEIIERYIDSIRSTGAEQPVFVDRPYVPTSDGDFLANVKPVNRSNVVWETHKYISQWSPTIAEFQAGVDVYVHKFVVGFGKPLFMGEYGIDPMEYRYQLSDWKLILEQQVTYLNNKNLCGRQWHSLDQLYGEFGSFFDPNAYNYEASVYIFTTVCGESA